MTKEEAIAAIEESRLTHVQWRDHLAEGACENCKRPGVIENVGDIDHHQKCIDKYDGVIELLRTLT